ncbi:TnpV protein [Bifidobacterium bifidum]|uniref:TnpV protein n=1 Tax=Bifidobacterium bifidum TaxID=1681 RepID=UPI003D00058D
MSEKEWLDPELKEKYEKNLAELRRKQREQPGKYRPNARPYKTITVNSVDDIERMRLIWMRDNHPRMTTEMMKAGELEDHLKYIAERTRQVADKYTRMLIDKRRQRGENDSETMAEMDAMHMAIQEVVESW